MMTAPLLLTVLSLLMGQVESDPKIQSAARLEFLKETAARIEIHTNGDGGKKLELIARPLLRWDNQRSFVVDAATFVWTSGHRPQVIGGVWIKNGVSHLDLQSLAGEPLTAMVDGKRIWSPARAGISWDIVPDSPRPAATRGERLRQMKTLARGFSAHAVKNAPDYDEGSVWELRMLPQPIHRYAEEAAADGAVFAFAQGTDPEAFLILEAGEEKEGGHWRYALAAACSWELHAKLGEHEVWSRPRSTANQRKPQDDYAIIGPFPIDSKLLPSDTRTPK
jgi:hypothetical protein